jgi:Competence protein J (ComJ)
MNKKASFDIGIQYAQFLVWPGFSDEHPRADAVFDDDEYAQGFTWDSRLISFQRIFYECYEAQVEVWEADEISLCSDTIRAVVLPFTITKGGLVVSDLFGGIKQTVPFAPGNYALVTEMKPRNDEEYLNSQVYQEDMEGGRMQAWCRFTLIPKEELVQPEILRDESGSRLTSPHSLAMRAAVYKLASFEIDIQETQFSVWSGPIPSDFTPPAISEQIKQQGFAWTSQVISFLTHKFTEVVVDFSPGVGLVSSVPEEYSKIVVEVRKSNKRTMTEEGRIISLPLSIREGGIVVSNLQGGQAHAVPFPAGNYQLIFEMRRTPDVRIQAGVPGIREGIN